MIAFVRGCSFLVLSGFLIAIPGFADNWARVYGGLDSEQAVGVELHPGGGYLVAGTTDFMDGPDSGDLWLMRLDGSGQIQWQKSYGGAGLDEACCLIETSGGSFVLGGTTTSFGSDGTDVWVLEVDTAGGILWQKRYAETGDQRLVGIDETASGYLLSANRETTPSHWDAWILEIDWVGEILWQKTYLADGAFTAANDDAAAMADGGFTVVGSSNSSGGRGTKLWVLRLDAAGEISWQKTYGGPDLLEMGFAIEAVGLDVGVGAYHESCRQYVV